jgi:hypothetical protein
MLNGVLSFEMCLKYINNVLHLNIFNFGIEKLGNNISASLDCSIKFLYSKYGHQFLLEIGQL